MKFKSLKIKNFRSFYEIETDLSNQNVVFGMNDVGKSNFLHALRFLFDNKVRRNGFLETDFYQNNIDEEISIQICISISDFEDSLHSQFIVSKVFGSRDSKNLDDIYIEVQGRYDKNEEMGGATLFWGNDPLNLIEVASKNSFYEIDKIFNVVYIDPSINLETLFKKYRKDIFKMNNLTNKDTDISEEIKNLTKDINTKVGTMEVIKKFEEQITEEYHSLKKEDLEVTIRSEMAIKGYFNDLIPYIKKNEDSNLYPTSGDGRKKILAYSLLNYFINNFETEKITLYLIEEPENNLHRSLQLALSKKLFSQSAYNYFFLTTHSSDLLYEMDDASLIRVYSEDKIKCSSTLYSVSNCYKSIKKQLNKSIATAIFAEKVLLVEGPSEKVLFEKVLSEVKPYFELEGIFILEINGIAFSKYTDVLESLNIIVHVKTDNDLRKVKGSKSEFELLGLNRSLTLCGLNKLNNTILEEFKDSSDDEIQNALIDKKRELFHEHRSVVKNLWRFNVYLSRVDLENDLYEVLGERLVEITGTKKPVKYLHSAKLNNMTNIITKLNKEDCLKIYNHELFKTLKGITT